MRRTFIIYVLLLCKQSETPQTVVISSYTSTFKQCSKRFKKITEISWKLMKKPGIGWVQKALHRRGMVGFSKIKYGVNKSLYDIISDFSSDSKKLTADNRTSLSPCSNKGAILGTKLSIPSHTCWLLNEYVRHPTTESHTHIRIRIIKAANPLRAEASRALYLQFRILPNTSDHSEF